MAKESLKPPLSRGRDAGAGRIPPNPGPGLGVGVPKLRPPLSALGQAEEPAHTTAKVETSNADLPPLPEPHFRLVELFTLIPGRAYVRILFDPKLHRHLYEVVEPAITAADQERLDKVRDALIRTMKGRPGAGEDPTAYLRRETDRVLGELQLAPDEATLGRLRYYVERDFVGYGPIDVLMRDPLIEDISCDGVGIPVFVFHRTYESLRTNLVFSNDEVLDAFVIRLAQRSGKQITMAHPLLDATLPDKSRLQASLAREVTTRGSSFTIRKFRADPLTPPDLIRMGTMTPLMMAYFWLAIEEGVSLLFAGGTASGKTSSLNAICTFIGPQRKIVSIEDTREINLPHENWIAGLTRPSEASEGATIDMFQLLVTALRQRPEYILVGEVRGREAITLFQAMATGHATYSTLHADSASSAVYRLENPPIGVPRAMIQTLGGISVQVQARVGGRMVRRVREVVEIVGVDPTTNDLLTNTVFEWDPAADEHRYLGKSNILDEVAVRRNLSNDEMQKEWEDRVAVLEWLGRTGRRRLDQVMAAVSQFYADRAEFMKQVRASPADDHVA